MTIRRFVLIFALGVSVQATTLAVVYDDLLYLRRPLSAIVASSPDVFARHAEHALARRTMTAQHLETIATAAKAFKMPALEVSALERRLGSGGGDSSTRLRLADALRRLGAYDRAERLYLDILRTSGGAP